MIEIIKDYFIVICAILGLLYYLVCWRGLIEEGLGIVGKIMVGLLMWVTLSALIGLALSAIYFLGLWLWGIINDILESPMWICVVVGCILVILLLYVLAKKDLISKNAVNNIYEGCMLSPIAFIILAILASPLIVEAWVAKIGGCTVEEVFLDSWYNPIVWLQCWWAKMISMGWWRFSFLVVVWSIAIITIRAELKGKSREDAKDYTKIAVYIFLVSLWFTPLLFFIGEFLLKALLKVFLCLDFVLSILGGSPEYM